MISYSPIVSRNLTNKICNIIIGGGVIKLHSLAKFGRLENPPAVPGDDDVLRPITEVYGITAHV